MGRAKSRGRIGYILRKFPVLSETFILNEILELEAQGHEVEIFSIEKPNDPRFHKNLHLLKSQVTYVSDKFGSLWEQRQKAIKNYPKGSRKAFLYALKQFNYDLAFRYLQSCFIVNEAKKRGISHFHAHFATRATTVAFLASMISGIPYSFTAHAVDIFKESLSKKALQSKIENAAFVVTVSDYNKQYLSDISSASANKMIKVNNGIDLEMFREASNRAHSPFTFLSVGRFVEKKGHKVLVDACEILRRDGVDFRCVMIGKGNLEPAITKAIAEKKLGDCVSLLGPKTQDEVLEQYRQSHVYVLPCTTGSDGNRDGLPVAIVEALACGIPVITTPMTGNPEVVKHRHNGLMVPFDNPKETAEAMRLLIEDRDLYASLRSNARKSIVDSFDIKQTVRNLASLFEEPTL